MIMRKLATLLFVFFAMNIYSFAQQDATFDYFLKGNVGSKKVLNIYTGSGYKLGTETFQITEKTIADDTSTMRIKCHLAGMGSLTTIYHVKYYYGISYLELDEFLAVANFVKMGVTTIEPEWLPYRSNMQVGDSLVGYFMKRKYGSHYNTTEQANRYVVEKDTLTTPAGTFECLKITYLIIGKTPSGTFKTGYTDWINKDLGLIRQESTTSSGRLENYFELVSYEIK